MILRSKVCLITGAGRGIGRAIALAYAHEQAQLVLTALEEDELEKVASEVRQLGGEAFVHPADVSDEDQVASLVTAALDRFQQVDVLVNNAGTLLMPADFPSTTPEMWDRTMSINVRSNYLMTHALLPKMTAQNYGRVINIASRAGLRGIPNRAAYCASKHAVVGLTRALALDVRGHNISVNAVCPGAVITPLTEKTRPGDDRVGWLEPEDIAGMAVYLASEAAKAVNGAIIEVDDRTI